MCALSARPGDARGPYRVPAGWDGLLVLVVELSAAAPFEERDGIGRRPGLAVGEVPEIERSRRRHALHEDVVGGGSAQAVVQGVLLAACPLGIVVVTEVGREQPAASKDDQSRDSADPFAPHAVEYPRRMPSLVLV
jgi:hypothetical protein